MAHLFQGHRIRLLCSCGLLKSITAIYFCRHCLKLRCSNCVSHEVDTLFCPNCLEKYAINRGSPKEKQVANCFYCPVAGPTLSTQAPSIPTRSRGSHKTVARKGGLLGLHHADGPLGVLASTRR
ncbi:Dynactin subunit 4 [Chionoecetes opilio]|uniref:Dynactin subunit 4 n=1 Tax=Chionoecetes opilio TaxID=41210 RepID=A0A8J8WE50_CHIOP|nr:Dynactin subunit 4 [Chionoecetes opilio]